MLGLGGREHQRLDAFSKGMKQKVVLAAALLHGPRCLILDEPLDGLDANAACVVKELLRSSSRRRAAPSCSARTSSKSSSASARASSSSTRAARSRKGRRTRLPNGRASATLDEAFAKLTGVRDAEQIGGDILRALERS